MSAEVWFRNPERYTPALVNLGVRRIVWHRGITIRRSIDPVVHARLSFGSGVDWRVMTVGAQGAVEWDQDSPSMHKPKACYPIWQYGEPFELLEELCASNVANDPMARHDSMVEPIYRPKKGQEHRVIIGSYPDLKTGPGRRLLVLLSELQEDYPDCILHIFSATTIRISVAVTRAADYDPFTPAAHGLAHLPNGRRVARGKYQTQRQWFNLLGTSIASLNTREALVEFNIRSALHAAEHWHETARFMTVRKHDTEPTLGELRPSRSHADYQGSPQPGDKVACDHCTLANSCKHYREGSVCNLPSSETAGLAQFFRTRDSERIIQGLGELLATQARRAEAGLEAEDEASQLDSEVTKILTQMFDGGVKLAKLVNPALAAAGAPKVAVQINNGRQIEASSPAALMAGLVRELEQRGIARSEITPEMIFQLVEPPKEILEARQADS